MKKNIIIDITADSRYKVNRKVIRETIYRVLAEERIQSKIEISVFVVGDRKMKQLNSSYRSVFDTTDVLSFPQGESSSKPFVKSPDNVLRLGDIVISYPTAVREAAEEIIMVNEELNRLTEHGLLHLLGYDHDEEGIFLNRKFKPV